MTENTKDYPPAGMCSCSVEDHGHALLVTFSVMGPDRTLYLQSEADIEAFVKACGSTRDEAGYIELAPDCWLDAATTEADD